MAVNPRSRSAQINNRAGESPSVNIPVLPIVGNPEPARLKTWAIALVNQLDILFDQIKSSLINLQRLIDDRPTWLNPYEPLREVRRLTMVEDDGWLMVSNKRTQDRAAPQPTAPPENVFPDTPPFVTQSLVGLVTCETSWILDQATGGLCQEYRVWVPDVGTSISYLLEVIIRQGPDGIPYSRIFFNPFLVKNEWNLVALADLPLSIGSLIIMRLHSLNVSSSTPLGPFFWRYGGTYSGQAVPKDGEYIVATNNKAFLFSNLDDGGTDRSANLLAAIPGTTGHFELSTDSEVFKDYNVLASPTDEGDYVSFPSVVQYAGKGNFTVGDLIAVGGETPVAQATGYSEIVGYYPSGDPSWGTGTSRLLLDDVEQGSHALDGYGVDLALAPGTVSPDWDYMNYAPVSDTGQGLGQQAFSGRIQRELDGQLIKGSVQTTDGSWTEVLRYDVSLSHKGKVFTSALRSDANDVYHSELAFLCLLNGSLSLKSTMVFQHSTAPSMRARIDSSGTFLLVEVQANNGQTWDWKVSVLKSDI